MAKVLIGKGFWLFVNIAAHPHNQNSTSVIISLTYILYIINI